ncbi:MAG TPA: hypothetical protein VFX30_12835 [bacterium]|nr:hypothetical protein [bacterium]
MKKYLIVTLLAGVAAWSAGCGQNTGSSGNGVAEETRSASGAGETPVSVEEAAPPPASDPVVAAVEEEDAAGADAAAGAERVAAERSAGGESAGGTGAGGPGRVIPGVELPPEAASVLPQGVLPGSIQEIRPAMTQQPLIGLHLPGRLYFLPQNVQDVTFLMNGDFQPDVFTARETEIQSRITAARRDVASAFLRRNSRGELWPISGVGFEVSAEDAAKQFAVAVLQSLILAERNNETEFRNDGELLGRILRALKADDGAQVGSLLRGSGLDHLDLWNQVVNYSLNQDELGYSGGVAKIGIYLELQFAEAMKDIAKASRHSRQEVLPESTLVGGGDALGLVYKPGCCFDQGWNHINGLANADLWYEGSANWARVADALRTALQAGMGR